MAGLLAAMTLIGCGGEPPHGWGEPFLITATSGTATGLRLAWSGGPQALAVWETEEAGTRRVHAVLLATDGADIRENASDRLGPAGRDPAQRPHAPMTLGTPGPGVLRKPDVAMDPSGRAVVAWLEGELPLQHVVTTRHDPDTGWATEDSMGIEFNDREPRVAVHPDGSALVAWVRNLVGGLGPTTSSNPVMSRAFQQGQGWGPERKLDTSVGSSRSPAVAFDGQGRGMVIWPQHDTERFASFPLALWCRDVNLSTGAGTTAWLEDLRVDAWMPQLVTLSDGRVLAAWRAFFDTSSELVVTSLFTPGTGWSVPQQPTGSAVFVESVSALSLAAGPGGTSAVMWTDRQNGRNRLGLNRLTGAQVTEPLFVVNEPDTVPLVPQLVLDAGGQAIWIWVRGPVNAGALWASDQAANGDPTPPVRLDLHDSAGATSAGLALGKDGKALATWLQNTPDGARLWGAWRYP
jgi:hypothetical protein